MNPLYIVAGFIFVGIVIIFVIYYSKTMKMTSYTAETTLLCKYSVHGHDYEITHVVRGLRASAYPAGKNITVWYNPNVPEMARIKNA